MLGGELLVAFAQREALRGLNETAGAVGKFLEIHILILGLSHRPRGAVGTSSWDFPVGPDLDQEDLEPRPTGLQTGSRYGDPALANVGKEARAERGSGAKFLRALAPCHANVKEWLTVRHDEQHIKAIYRYPVKGLSPESLPSVALASGGTLPVDRAYAIENGPSGFDPAAPAYFPKIRFLMLMRNERLARLKTRFDDATMS